LLKIHASLAPAPSPALAAAPVSEEEGRDGHDADVEAVIRDLTSGKPLTCSVCLADNATCVGAYEDPRDLRFACSGCCGHGNEDGWCVPLPAPAPPPSTGDARGCTCAWTADFVDHGERRSGPHHRSACPMYAPSPRAQTGTAAGVGLIEAFEAKVAICCEHYAAGRQADGEDAAAEIITAYRRALRSAALRREEPSHG
jgi:hypothetical protein